MTGIIVLILYAVIMLAATMIFTSETKNGAYFHNAGGNIGAKVGAMSIAATWIWAPALFVSAEKAYTNGIPGLFWFLVPNVLCLIIFIPFAKRMKAKYPDGITLTGYMEKTYNSKRVKGVYTFQLGALAVLSTAVQLLAGGKMLSALTGVPFWLMTIILAAIGYSYSRISGLKASVTTDVVQLLIILTGCAVIVPWLISKSGGIDTVIAGLRSVTGEYTSLGSKSGISVLLGFGLPTTIGLISGPFGDQCFWQRTFAIKRDKIGRSFLVGALIFGIVPLAMGLVGYSAAGSGFISADSGMVNMEFISAMLPSWVMIPFFLMVVSGLLSTVDSNLCAAASMTTDFSNLKGKHNIRLSRLVMVALLAVAIVIANIPGLTVTHLFLFYGTLRASTLLPTAFTLYGRKLTASGVFYGVIAAMCIGLPIFAYGNIQNIAIWKTIGSLTTVLISGAVALVTSRKKEVTA